MMHEARPAPFGYRLCPGRARTVTGGFEIATFWAPVPERF